MNVLRTIFDLFKSILGLKKKSSVNTTEGGFGNEVVEETRVITQDSGTGKVDIDYYNEEESNSAFSRLILIAWDSGELNENTTSKRFVANHLPMGFDNFDINRIRITPDIVKFRDDAIKYGTIIRSKDILSIFDLI